MGIGELVTVQLGCAGEDFAPAFWDIQVREFWIDRVMYLCV